MHRSTLLRLVAGLVLALTTLAPSVATADMSLAVIDLQRAIADTEDGLRMRSQLQSMVDQSKVDFDQKQKALEAAKAEFQKLQKQGASQQALQQKYAELERMNYDLQVAQRKSERELVQKENELTMPILNALMGLVRQLAGQNGYDMVLAKQAAPYFRKDLDITDRVIQMYNASQSPTPATPKKGAKPRKRRPTRAPAPKRGPKGKTTNAPKKRTTKKPAKKGSKQRSTPKRSPKG